MRSKRLQVEARARARQEEQQILSQLMESRRDDSPGTFLLLGVDPVPAVKVRAVGSAPEPPKEWGE